MIFYREVKRKAPETKIDKESPEWKEFIKAYRDINNNGSYDKRLISKYHKVIKETPHKQIMENLKDYKKFLQVNKTRNPLQAPTYINQERYMDTWEVIKDVSRKFINDIYKEKDLNADEIDNINTEISAYELKHKREVTN
jgi:hypothetical protein